MSFLKTLLLVLSIAIQSGAASADYSADDLMRMTIESLSYDIKSDTASATGVGKIPDGNPYGTMLARRAAITDAQRGLLILRRSIIEKEPPRPGSVSGSVPPFEILSEDVRDGLYFVEIRASLSDLAYDEQQYEEEDIP